MKMRIGKIVLIFFVSIGSVISDKNAKIIIVGSGAAGTAAASKLFDNGFTNVTILEAENRIGGRVFTTKIGDYLVDMGGQWVHGDVENIVFDMAWPLGLLQRSKDYGEMSIHKFYGSSSDLDVSKEIAHKIHKYFYEKQDNISLLDSPKLSSLGDQIEASLDEFLQTIPEVSPEQKKPIINMLNRADMGLEGAHDWHDVSANRLKDYDGVKGDMQVNWKDKGYSTILDVLMKKIPNPEQELPLMNNTILNTRVKKINYKDGLVSVTTEDGKNYHADHVIFTASLGVLKENYDKLFTPSLPEKKINAIKNLGFGGVAKIYLLYDEPWWKGEENFDKNLLWGEKDRAELENNPERKWMLGVYGVITVEHKPKLLCIWLTGNYSKQMEEIPEELFRNQTLQLVERFFGRDYNVTQPKEIKRTMWNTNENTRGTYGYHSIDTERFEAKNEDLAEPIMRHDKPIIQFAGEATAPGEFSTVHGAVKSGFREANRLIKLYVNEK